MHSSKVLMKISGKLMTAADAHGVKLKLSGTVLYFMDHMTCYSFYYHCEYLMVKYLPVYRVFLKT